MSTPTQKCDSGLAHDSHEKQCGGWCSVKEATHHCTWCKCAACDYCRPRESVTHVYASAGAGKAVCAESAAVAYPPSAEGSADDASRVAKRAIATVANRNPISKVARCMQKSMRSTRFATGARTSLTVRAGAIPA